MPMPKKVRCERCRRHVAECGELSARKLCADCCEAAITSAILQLRARRGPIFERYRAGLADYVVNLYRGDMPPSPATLVDESTDVATQDHTVLLPSS